MTANPQPAVRVDARAEPADQWRKLALQFDMHRIDALSVLRGVVAGTVSTEDVRAFLAAPPRASALTPAPTEAGGVRLRAVSDNGKRWRVIPEDGDWEMVPTGHITAGQAKAVCERIEAALSSTPAADAGWQGDPICRKCATQEHGSPALPSDCSCGDHAAAIEVGTTARGFTVARFSDINDIACTLQKSSLATEDAIWLGASDIGLKRFTPYAGWEDVPTPSSVGGVSHVANNRMHLTREHVRALLPLLQRFVSTGELAPPLNPEARDER